MQYTGIALGCYLSSMHSVCWIILLSIHPAFSRRYFRMVSVTTLLVFEDVSRIFYNSKSNTNPHPQNYKNKRNDDYGIAITPWMGPLKFIDTTSRTCRMYGSWCMLSIHYDSRKFNQIFWHKIPSTIDSNIRQWYFVSWLVPLIDVRRSLYKRKITAK